MCLLFTHITPLDNCRLPLPSLPPLLPSPIPFLFVTRKISLPFFCLKCSGWQKILVRDHPKNIAHRNLLFWASNPYFLDVQIESSSNFFFRRRPSIHYFIVVTFSCFTRKQIRKRNDGRSNEEAGNEIAGRICLKTPAQALEPSVKSPRSK